MNDHIVPIRETPAPEPDIGIRQMRPRRKKNGAADQAMIEEVLHAIREMWNNRSDQTLTQEQAADQMGLSKSAFNHILTGDYKLVGFIQILKLARILGTSIDAVTQQLTLKKAAMKTSSDDETVGSLSHKELGELMTRIYEVVGEEYSKTNPETRMAWALEAFKQLTNTAPTREEIVTAIKNGIVERAQSQQPTQQQSTQQANV